jgi:hypothetical protein
MAEALSIIFSKAAKLPFRRFCRPESTLWSLGPEEIGIDAARQPTKHLTFSMA